MRARTLFALRPPALARRSSPTTFDVGVPVDVARPPPATNFQAPARRRDSIAATPRPRAWRRTGLVRRGHVLSTHRNARGAPRLRSSRRGVSMDALSRRDSGILAMETAALADLWPKQPRRFGEKDVHVRNAKSTGAVMPPHHARHDAPVSNFAALHRLPEPPEIRAHFAGRSTARPDCSTSRTTATPPPPLTRAPAGRHAGSCGRRARDRKPSLSNCGGTGKVTCPSSNASTSRRGSHFRINRSMLATTRPPGHASEATASRVECRARANRLDTLLLGLIKSVRIHHNL